MSKINKWISSGAITKIVKGGCKCPYCESADVDYTYTRYKGHQGSFYAWCNDCKRAVHASAIVPEDTKLKVVDDKDLFLPEGLKF